MGKSKTRDPIPEFETLDDIAEFWDSHSTADYDDLTHEVEFEVRLGTNAQHPQTITLLPELSETLQALADTRGVSVLMFKLIGPESACIIDARKGNLTCAKLPHGVPSWC